MPENIRVIQILDKDAPQNMISLEKLRDRLIYNEDNEQYQILEKPITELVLEEKTIDSKKRNEIIEKLAEYEHKKWSEDYDRIDWKGKRNKDGSFEISEDDIRQIQEYSNLDYEQVQEFYKKEIRSVIMETFYIMQENHMIDELGVSDEELISVLEHTEYMRRNRWSQYMLSLCQINDGKYIIPAEKAKLWKSEMRTPYAELNEKQKESDRKEVNNIFLEIKKYINMKQELKSDYETQETIEPNIQEDTPLQRREAELASLEQIEKEMIAEERKLASILNEKQGQDIGE